MDTMMYVAFVGSTMMARGALSEVVRAAKEQHDHAATERIAVFDEATGRPIDIDWSGSPVEVIDRLAEHPAVAPPPPPQPATRGPGRPKLGVVSREVSLLPRHWEWLAAQRGGASATLRRLVDTARKQDSAQGQVQQVVEVAHRFMWDIAGDFTGFEEASRALFAHDFSAFTQCIVSWPQSIREQLQRYVQYAQLAEEPHA